VIKSVRALPWIVAAVTVAQVTATLVLDLSASDAAGRYRLGPTGVLFIIGVAVFAPVGALIALRQPRNPLGWIALFVGFFVTLNDALYQYVVSATYDARELPAADVVGWVQSWIWTVGFSLMGLLMLLFPTGSPPSRRWRTVVWMLVVPPLVVPVIMLSVWGENVGFFVDDRQVEAAVGPPVQAMIFLLFGGLALSLVSLVVRYRRAAGDQRRQLKWIGYAAAVLAMFTVINVFVFELLGLIGSPVAIAVEYIGSLAIGAFPIAVGMAVFKHRLFDIDLIVNRTLVYGALTAILVAAYGLGVLIFTTILDPVTGDNDIAIAASTLAVAALFGPARRRIQSFIDRRFYRSRYDAQQTLEGFARRLREEVDLDALSAEVVAVIGSTVQPAFAGVWLANRNDFRTIDRYKESHERDR
jgi:hypothetical protein